jgi:hypothetical protein
MMMAREIKSFIMSALPYALAGLVEILWEGAIA